jgi:TM2 domain-containing membrane protein YozV
MDCVNHSGVSATAYCQNCGKALCGACVKTAPGGQVLCEPCWMTWHSVQTPFTAGYTGEGPNPAVAAALGIIPGVGAMYNGQFLKGFVHVFVFAILVSTAGRFPIFGLFIAAWVIYQSFEAFHVAKARRDGQPPPDPLGLNEISNWLNFGGRGQQPPPGMGTGPAGANPAAGAQFSGTAGPYQAPPQTPPWQTPYPGEPGYGQGQGSAPASDYRAGYPNPGFPPIPPIPPPMYWKRKEPIGAVILIGLGLMFLVGQLDLFSGQVFKFTWPLLLIGLGVWMVVRHVQSSQGGPK